MKKVFILGGTSPTGKILLSHLQSSKDLDITCYVRSPEKLTSFKNLKIIKGDILDQENLTKSMKDNDIIITLLSGYTVKNQAENVINSMKKNNLKRIIWMTGMGIHHEVPGPIKELLDKLVESQPQYVEAANLIMNSGLEYTLLRAAHLTDGNNRKYYTQKEGEPLRCNTCDRIAIAQFIGEIIDNFELYKNISIGLTN